jgi:hypothetical protein
MSHQIAGNLHLYFAWPGADLRSLREHARR